MKQKRSRQSKRAKLAGLPKPKKSTRAERPPKIKAKRGAMVQKVHDQDALVPLICKRVSKGEFLTHVLRDLKIDPSTFYDWIDADEERAKLYARAKLRQSHSIAVEIQDIADGADRRSIKAQAAIERQGREWARKGVRDWRHRVKMLESNLINRNRLQVDARKWYARALNPKGYGDKVDVTSGGGEIKAPGTLLVQFVGPDGKPVAPGSPGETAGDTATGRGDTP